MCGIELNKRLPAAGEPALDECCKRMHGGYTRGGTNAMQKLGACLQSSCQCWRAPVGLWRAQLRRCSAGASTTAVRQAGSGGAAARKRMTVGGWEDGDVGRPSLRGSSACDKSARPAGSPAARTQQPAGWPALGNRVQQGQARLPAAPAAPASPAAPPRMRPAPAAVCGRPSRRRWWCRRCGCPQRQ